MIRAEQILIMVEPVDMRLGIDGLTMLVQRTLQGSACDGRMYLFRNRSGNRLKALCWDGNGVWLCHRRLHQGRFHWPSAGERVFSLSQAQFDGLVMGLEWQRIDRPNAPLWML